MFDTEAIAIILIQDSLGLSCGTKRRKLVRHQLAKIFDIYLKKQDIKSRITFIIKSNQKGDGICVLSFTGMLDNRACWNNATSLQEQKGQLLHQAAEERGT